MTERELQDLILALCKAQGILGWHAYDSRRTEPGWPDLVLVGRNGVLYRELKTEKGRLSPAQTYWIEALVDAGQNAGVWRPADWPDQIVKELKALGRSAAQKPLPTQAQIRKKLARRDTNRESSGS